MKTERLSYLSFQKLCGKSVGMRTLGMLVEMLSRKAENAGGGAEQINTWETKLPKNCHYGHVVAIIHYILIHPNLAVIK